MYPVSVFDPPALSPFPHVILSCHIDAVFRICWKICDMDSHLPYPSHNQRHSLVKY
jgi:hypothetical protein